MKYIFTFKLMTEQPPLSRIDVYHIHKTKDEALLLSALNMHTAESWAYLHGCGGWAHHWRRGRWRGTGTSGLRCTSRPPLMWVTLIIDSIHTGGTSWGYSDYLRMKSHMQIMTPRNRFWREFDQWPATGRWPLPSNMRFEYTSLVIFYAMTCLLFPTFFLCSVSKSIDANEYLHVENQYKKSASLWNNTKGARWRKETVNGICKITQRLCNPFLEFFCKSGFKVWLSAACKCRK